MAFATYDNSGRSVSSEVRKFASAKDVARDLQYEPRAVYADSSAKLIRKGENPDTGNFQAYGIREVISMLQRHDLDLWQYVLKQYDPYTTSYKLIYKAYKRALYKEAHRKHEFYIEDYIASDAVSNMGHRLETSFESSIAAKLHVFDIPFEAHTKHFLVNVNGASRIFSPDFYLPMKYHSKQILLEVHAMNYFTPAYLDTLRAFMKSPAANDYYFILITNVRPKKSNKLKIMMNKYKVKEKDICDKLVYIHYNPRIHSETNLKNESGSVYYLFSLLRRQGVPATVEQ